jgi:putative transposase
MNKSSKYRTGRTCVFNMHIHLVFVTKYRRKVFTKKVLKELEKIFKKVCLKFDASLIEINGEYDHVHLLVHYHPKVAISKLVNSLKGVSSRLLRKQKIPAIEKALWGQSLWSPSYFASSCGGAPLDIIEKYIKSQNLPN